MEENTYTISYSEEFLDDLERHKTSENKQIIKKIYSFFDELETNPTGGTGQPEALKGYGERFVFSKRINGKHRLIYEIFEDLKIVEILTAYGHYKDK